MDFDESKNSFANWAAAIARYRSIDYLRQFQRELDVVNIEEAVLSQVMEKEISEELEQMLGGLKNSRFREKFLGGRP